MPLTNKSLAYAAALLTALVLLIGKLPYLRLAGELASGTIDGRRIAVVDFVGRPFAETTATLRCGGLLLDAPAGVRTEPQSPEDSCGFWLMLNGVACWVLPPRFDTGSQDAGTVDWSREYNRGGIDWQAAICSTSGRDLSIRMNSGQVASLEERLETKSFLCMGADRVELVRGKELCGLLLIWHDPEQPRMLFQYFTPDGRACGTLFLSLAPRSPQAPALARAIVSSLRIESPTGQAGAISSCNKPLELFE